MGLKILIASVNHEHATTMHINYYHALADVADVTFFGPGFSSQDDLEKGIRQFAETHGKFDAVIYTFPLFLHSLDFFPIREAYKWNRYFLSYYSVHEAVRYASGILNEIRQMDTLKLILYSQDYINLTESWEKGLRWMLEKDFYIITWGEDFVPDMDEKSCRTFGESLVISNRYKCLVKEYKEKVISIPYEAVISSEYYFGTLQNREFDWVVPGNIDGCYPKRGKILEQVEQAGYKIYKNFADRTMAYKTDPGRVDKCHYNREIDRFIDERLGVCTPYLKNDLTREALVCWRERYNVSLRSSRIAYADGGSAHTFVQKYMEIPARGTLLAADYVCGLDKLGFLDGENMVAVTPENVLDISAELFRNSDKMEQIARKGQKLVISKHTSAKRAQDTVRAIESILNKNFSGSFWENGDFHIISNK